MATLRQSVQSPASGATVAGTTYSVTLASAALADSLLIVVLTVDKNSGVINLPTDNIGGTWAFVDTQVATDVSGAFAYKVAAGGETTISGTYTTSQLSESYAQEWTGIGSPALDKKALATSGTANVTTQSTGTTAVTTATGLAIAVVFVDSIVNWGAASPRSLSWTNSFTARASVGDNLTTGGIPGAGVASRDAIASGTAVETTMSSVNWTTADQAFGIVGVFKSGGGDTTPPAAPGNLSGNAGVGVASFAWDPNGESDLSHYNIYRGTASSGPYSKINPANLTSPSYVMTGLTGGVTYYVVVRAVDTTGNESSDSNEVAVTPTNPVGTVTNRMVGGVTAYSAKAAGKFSGVSSVRMAASTTSDLLTDTKFSSAVSVDPTYNRAIAEVTGLDPNTSYYWAWERDGVLSTDGGGQFKAFPEPGYVGSFSFAYGSCADQNVTNGQNPSSMTHVLNRNPRPLFVMHDGDIHYSDVNTNVVADHLAAVDNLLTYATRQQIWSEIPAVRTWSDHDFCGDASNKNFTGRNAAVEAFRRSTPNYPYVVDTSFTDPIYQEPFVVGRCVFFMLDCRSMKDTYNSGTDASRSLLGQAQEDWLLSELVLWKNYVKFLISDVPWMAGPVDPAVTGYSADDDHWGAYRTQRKRIGDFCLNNGVKNVIMMAGDMHCCAADDGGTKGSGIYSAGNFPIFQSAPWARGGSFKGDGVGATHPALYDFGPLPAKGDLSIVYQYGWVDVADSGGSTLDVTWRAYNGAGTALLGPLTITATFGEKLSPDGVITQTNDTKTLTQLQRDPDTTTGWP